MLPGRAGDGSDLRAQRLRCRQRGRSVGPSLDGTLRQPARHERDRVAAHDGHKSLYSDAYYDRETFDRLYGVANQRRVKQETDPDNRLTGLYEKAVNRR